MSEADHSHQPKRDAASRGQSLVEFALVLPMLLVLLLGIADFARVFTAGIATESAARNGAEAAAQEYVQMARNRPGGTLLLADYESLHDLAAGRVCADADVLPNKVEAGGVCSMPSIAVCIHDTTGDLAGCGVEAASAPAECTDIHDTWDGSNAGPALGNGALAYVEVRLCYRFTTLINLSGLDLPFGWGLDLGDVYLQRDREFAVACYWTATGACN